MGPMRARHPFERSTIRGMRVTTKGTIRVQDSGLKNKKRVLFKGILVEGVLDGA